MKAFAALFQALDATTGARRWTATLSDVTSYDCADCFAAVDGTLVVRTQDAVVAGFARARALILSAESELNWGPAAPAD